MESTSAIAPIDGQLPEAGGSLRNAAIAEIRRLIVAGEMPAEVSFSEGAISEQLGISRAPVREALIVLNQLGWVTAQPRSGYLVSPLTLNNLRELFGLRALLEPRAASLAARKAGGDYLEPGSLEEFSDRRDDPADAGWLDAHYRFHRRIVIGANDRELDRVLTEVLLKLERYLALDSVRQALIEEPVDHHALTLAIRDGDAKAAGEAAAVHISQSQLLVTDAILGSDGIRSAPLTPPRPTIFNRPA